jgi:hypothetical protein
MLHHVHLRSCIDKRADLMKWKWGIWILQLDFVGKRGNATGFFHCTCSNHKKSPKIRIPFHLKSCVCLSHFSTRPFALVTLTKRASGWVGKSVSIDRNPLGPSHFRTRPAFSLASKTGSSREKCLRAVSQPPVPIKM